MQTKISHSKTKFLKYVPILLSPIGLITGIDLNNITIIVISILFFLFIGLTSMKIVEAWTDKEAIYIKKWKNVQKYTFDRILKINELKKGLTEISVNNVPQGSSTFLIIDSPKSKNVVKLLTQLKSGYRKKGRQK